MIQLIIQRHRCCANLSIGKECNGVKELPITGFDKAVVFESIAR